MSAKTFIVEKILEKKTENGQDYFLIKWEGYGDKENSWEPRANLSAPLVTAFERENRRRSRAPKEDQTEAEAPAEPVLKRNKSNDPDAVGLKRTRSSEARTPSKSPAPKPKTPRRNREVSPHPGTESKTRSGRTPARSPARSVAKSPARVPARSPARTTTRTAAIARDVEVHTTSVSDDSGTTTRRSVKKTVTKEVPSASGSPVVSSVTRSATTTTRSSPSQASSASSSLLGSPSGSSLSRSSPAAASSGVSPRPVGALPRPSTASIVRSPVAKPKQKLKNDDFALHSLPFITVLLITFVAAVLNSTPSALEWVASQDPFGIVTTQSYPAYTMLAVGFVLYAAAMIALRDWSRNAHVVASVSADGYASDLGRLMFSFSLLLCSLGALLFGADKDTLKSNLLALATSYNLQDVLLNNHTMRRPRIVLLLLDAIVYASALLIVNDAELPRWLSGTCLLLRTISEVLTSFRRLTTRPQSELAQLADRVNGIIITGGNAVLGVFFFVYVQSAYNKVILMLYLGTSMIFSLLDEGLRLRTPY